MLGNDIVDLTTAKLQSDWRRPGFLSKLFTPYEQDCIHAAHDPFRMVWRLWSMKEAAYKLYTRMQPGRFYLPRGFECNLGRQGGSVRFGDFHCVVTTRAEQDFILSEARLEASAFTSQTVHLGEKDIRAQSKTLRRHALKYLAHQRKAAVDDFRMESSEFGIPHVRMGSEIIPISLTHHGAYGAFALP